MSDGWEVVGSVESPITDDLLDRLRHVESGGNPKAVGPNTRFGTAKGAYQFTDDTAKRFGIDPFDEPAARSAARSYLSDMHGQFGDTDLALAGYNWGPGNVAKLLKAGYTKDEILAKAPKETQDYVKKINKSGDGWEVVGKADNEWETVGKAEDGWEVVGKASEDGFVTRHLKAAGDTIQTAFDADKGANPLKGALGVAAGVGDMFTQGVNAVGDVVLQGMAAEGPAGRLLKQVIRPDLKPGFGGIQEDIQQNTENINKAVLPDMLKTPDFAAGRELPALPFEVLGITDAIHALPKPYQDAVNTLLMGTMGAALLRGRGAKGPSAKVQWPPEPGTLKAKEVPAESPPVAAGDVLKQMTEGETPKPTETAPEVSKMPEGSADPVQGHLDLESPLMDRPLPGEVVEKAYKRPPKGLEKDLFGGENLAREELATKVVRDEQIAKAFDEANPAKDILGKEYDKALEQRKAQDTVARMAEEDQARSINISALKGEKGAVNFGKGEDLSKRLETLKENLLNMDRSGEGIKEGQTVRLMNGKTGVVQKIIGDRYQVKGKDFVDSIPRQGIDYAYVPQKAVSTNFLKAAAKKQGGHGDAFKDLGKALIDGGAKIGKLAKNNLRSPDAYVNFSEQNIKDIVRTALQESKTPEGFAQRMKLSGLRPDFVALADKFWESKDTIIANSGESTFSTLDKASRRQADDINRSAEQFIKDEKYDVNPPKQDIGIIPRIVNVLNVQKLVHANKDVGPLVNWVLSKTNKFIGDGVMIYKELSGHYDAFRALPYKDKTNLTQVMIDMDQNNAFLKDAGLQWATTDMLKERGLNDAQIAAYHDLTKGMDKAWKMIQNVFAEEGRPPPPQIPGYFPHMWQGSYRVILRDASGQAVKMYAHATGAQAFIREKIAKREGYTTERINPATSVKSNTMLADLIDRLDIENRPFDKAVAAKIVRMEQLTKRGIMTELLERNANLGGHMAEEGTKPGYLHAHHNDVLNNMLNQYFEDIATHYANTQIVNHVYTPLLNHPSLLEHVPNTKGMIEEVVGRATGHAINHLSLLDSIGRSAAVKMGLPPNMVSVVTRSGAQYLYWAKLSAGNGLYVVAQLIQPLVGARMISRVHAERGEVGAKQGNVWRALGEGLKEYVSLKQGEGSADAHAAKKYFEDRGITDANQADMVDPSALSKRITNIASLGISRGLEHVETHNRMATALMYYHYFKQVMPPAEALRAAATQMGLTMGEYSRGHSAGMFTDLGVVGHNLRPFAMLPNTYLGEAYMNAALAGRVGKRMLKGEASVGDFGAAMLPTALMTANMMFWSGATGIIGFNDYNTFVRIWNAFHQDDPMLEAGAKLRQLGFNKAMIYGMLGSWTDINLGPAINMPSVADQGRFPGPTALATAASLLAQALRAQSGNGYNMGKALTDFRRLAPGWAGQWAAEEVADTQGGQVPGTDGTLDKNTVKRTKSQSIIARLSGRASVSEQSERDENAIKAKMKSADEKWKQEKVTVLTDILQGLPMQPDFGKTVSEVIAADRGVSDEVLKSVLKKFENRFKDTNTKNLEEIDTAKNQQLQARLQQIQDILKGR